MNEACKLIVRAPLLVVFTPVCVLVAFYFRPTTIRTLRSTLRTKTVAARIQLAPIAMTERTLVTIQALCLKQVTNVLGFLVPALLIELLCASLDEGAEEDHHVAQVAAVDIKARKLNRDIRDARQFEKLIEQYALVIGAALVLTGLDDMTKRAHHLLQNKFLVTAEVGPFGKINVVTERLEKVVRWARMGPCVQINGLAIYSIES